MLSDLTIQTQKSSYPRLFSTSPITTQMNAGHVFKQHLQKLFQQKLKAPQSIVLPARHPTAKLRDPQKTKRSWQDRNRREKAPIKNKLKGNMERTNTDTSVLPTCSLTFKFLSLLKKLRISFSSNCCPCFFSPCEDCLNVCV